MDRKSILKKIVSILSSHGAKKILLFGSFARGEEKKGSDIDLLVDFKDKKSLIETVSIENEISKKTGKRVELLTEKAISPYLIEKIKSEAKALYA